MNCKEARLVVESAFELARNSSAALAVAWREQHPKWNRTIDACLAVAVIEQDSTPSALGIGTRLGPTLDDGAGRYELLETIGAGAHGWVIRAADRALRCEGEESIVAIKIVVCPESEVAALAWVIVSRGRIPLEPAVDRVALRVFGAHALKITGPDGWRVARELLMTGSVQSIDLAEQSTLASSWEALGNSLASAGTPEPGVFNLAASLWFVQRQPVRAAHAAMHNLVGPVAQATGDQRTYAAILGQLSRASRSVPTENAVEEDAIRLGVSQLLKLRQALPAVSGAAN